MASGERQLPDGVAARGDPSPRPCRREHRRFCGRPHVELDWPGRKRKQAVSPRSADSLSAQFTAVVFRVPAKEVSLDGLRHLNRLSPGSSVRVAGVESQPAGYRHSPQSR